MTLPPGARFVNGARFDESRAVSPSALTLSPSRPAVNPLGSCRLCNAPPLVTVPLPRAQIPKSIVALVCCVAAENDGRACASTVAETACEKFASCAACDVLLTEAVPPATPGAAVLSDSACALPASVAVATPAAAPVTAPAPLTV